MSTTKNLHTAVTYIQDKLNGFQPDLAMILGSGLGMLAEEVDATAILPYTEIPGFAQSTVRGHKGRLVFGELKGKKVVVMQGRLHYYEGYHMDKITFPVKVFHQLGVSKLLVTNAAGGVNPSFQAGDFMFIKDHINFSFNNPFMGLEKLPNLDKRQVYSTELLSIARNAAKTMEIPVHEGTYIFMTGPSFETPSEVKMAGILGADAVGMSTFPETIMANSLGLKVLGLSYISNQGAGISPHPLSHQEVIDTMEAIKETCIRLISGIIEALPVA